MILDDKKNLNYLFDKAVDALLFSYDYDYVFEKMKQIFVIDSQGLLNCIYNKLNSVHDIMDDIIKKNLFNIVNYFRYEYKCLSSEKDFINNICNSIIVCINSSTRDKTRYFVKEQLKKRGFNKASVYNATRDEFLDDAFLDVKDFIVSDFNILCLHTELCSEQDYKNSIPDLIDIQLPCMYTFNLLLDENENLLLDKTFKKRFLLTNILLEKNIIENGNQSMVPHNILQKEYKLYQKKLLKLI